MVNPLIQIEPVDPLPKSTSSSPGSKRNYFINFGPLNKRFHAQKGPTPSTPQDKTELYMKSWFHLIRTHRCFYLCPKEVGGKQKKKERKEERWEMQKRREPQFSGGSPTLRSPEGTWHTHSCAWIEQVDLNNSSPALPLSAPSTQLREFVVRLCGSRTQHNNCASSFNCLAEATRRVDTRLLMFVIVLFIFFYEKFSTKNFVNNCVFK